MSAAFIKDPSATLDYVFDFTPWLATGETITAATVAAPVGITVAPTGFPTVVAATSVTVWLAGGTEGVRYAVTVHITTSAGRQDDRTINVRVVQR